MIFETNKTFIKKSKRKKWKLKKIRIKLKKNTWQIIIKELNQKEIKFLQKNQGQNKKIKRKGT